VLPILLVAVAVVALGAAVLVVRGLGGKDTGEKAQQVLDRAVKEEAKSAAVEMHLTTTITAPVRGAGGRFEWRLAGRGTGLTSGRATGSFHVDERSPGERPVSLDELSTGSQGFIRVDGRWYRLSSTQYERVFERDDANPLRWMVNPTSMGTTTVDGVDANRIRGDANVNEMLTDLDAFEAGSADSPAQRRVVAAIKAAPKRGSMDIGAGKQDGILRKGSVSGQMNTTLGTTPLHVALAFTFAFTDVNQPVTVRAPKHALPPSRIRRLSRAKLGSAAGDVFVAPAG